jgi:hypothetical protein
MEVHRQADFIDYNNNVVTVQGLAVLDERQISQADGLS